MYQSTVRSTTANPGKTALALVAILSLLLSLFAIARPVIAFDDTAGPAVTPSVQPGNPACPEGTTDIKFEGGNLVEGRELSVVIDGETVTVTITDVNVAAGTFNFEVTGGLAHVVIAKGGPNANVYDYRPLGGAAHDDGLSTPINPNNDTPYGISHISFCVVPLPPTGSIEVLKTDEAGAPLDGAVFTVEGQEGTFTTGEDGTFCVDGLTIGDVLTVTEITPPGGYTGAGPQDVTVAVEGDCDERGDAAVDATFVNALIVEEDLGSITIDKQLGECEACEAFTPGYWFNRGGGGGVDWANTWLGVNPQDIEGIGIFDSVADVQAYLDADRADGGLSATGQLLRHYLALVLNVAFATANDCDLGSLVYGDMTVAEWLDAALIALETGASDDDKREIKDALDAINNSDAGDGTLECGDTEGGAHAGVMFELYNDADELVDSGTTGEDGSLLLDGDPDGTGLPLGTYTLVETTNDADLECSIVSVSGEGATLNEDGTVTIVLTEENAHVTITVVNECEEQPVVEDEFGHISVIKETNEAEPAESFAFEATWDEDGFILMDGGLEPSGDLLAGEDYTVTEVLTEAQIAAGWSLEDIDCEGAEAWTVSEDGMSVTITLGADEDVVCTFTNELEDQEAGELEIIKFFCPTVGTDAIFVFGPLAEEPVEMSLQQLDDNGELPSDEGCTLGAPSEEALGATFTITGGDLTEPMVVITEWEEILTLDLAPGDYTIVEEGTGLTADFTVLADGDTAVVVFNYGEEAEEEGRLKILKFYCVGEGDPVFTAVDGDAGLADVTLPTNCASPEPGDADFTLTMGELTSGVFDLGTDGARLIPLPAGTYVLNEVDPNEASSAEFAVTADETTTVIVFNFEEEGEAPSEGQQPSGGRAPTTGEGTLGGNPLPNTAISPTPNGSVPAALLALLMLSSLGAAAYAVKAEVRRRR